MTKAPFFSSTNTYLLLFDLNEIKITRIINKIAIGISRA